MNNKTNSGNNKTPFKIDSVDLGVWTIIALVTAILWFTGGWKAAMSGATIYIILALLTGLYFYLYEFSELDKKEFLEDGFWWDIYILISYWWAFWLFKLSASPQS